MIKPDEFIFSYRNIKGQCISVKVVAWNESEADKKARNLVGNKLVEFISLKNRSEITRGLLGK